MPANSSEITTGQGALRKSLHDHWLLFLVEGIVLLVLGLSAVALPAIASVAITLVVGWVLLISGIVGLVTTLRMRSAPGPWWSLVSAVLGIVAGVVLLGWPLSGTVSLTVILCVFFAIEGAVSIMYALEHQRRNSGRWGWMLVSGIVDLVLAGIIVAGLPGTATWILGLLVGINMIFGGVALVAMAWHARASDPGSSMPVS